MDGSFFEAKNIPAFCRLYLNCGTSRINTFQFDVSFWQISRALKELSVLFCFTVLKNLSGFIGALGEKDMWNLSKLQVAFLLKKKFSFIVEVVAL